MVSPEGQAGQKNPISPEFIKPFALGAHIMCGLMSSNICSGDYSIWVANLKSEGNNHEIREELEVIFNGDNSGFSGNLKFRDG